MALITGALRGIGLATARLLAHRRFRIVITARGDSGLREAAAGLALQVEVVAPAIRLARLRWLWSRQARSAVRGQALFDSHEDFLDPQHMPALATALEAALQRRQPAGRAQAGDHPAGPVR
ncbi:MAG: SDR family NAD(P)-dependent oxidoreductase [Synechococcaceae cyanobacterium]|nr:SDR family NAD(P)-dependent oxidoreductase [Synechococcaceae cyanobacterium]